MNDIKINNHTESQLRNILKSIHVQINAIRSIYHLPNKFNNGNYIFLTSPSDVSNGHWTCMKVFPDHIEYMDSYGMPPPQSIVNKAKGKKIIYNLNQIQKLIEHNCGLFCIDFLASKSFDSFLDKYHIYQTM